MIEKEKLKYWAIQLETEIYKYKSVSTGAEQLSNATYILDAIEDAKNLKIHEPTERLGSMIPFTEYTDLKEFTDLLLALCRFQTLIEGWKLLEDRVTSNPNT